MTRTHDHHLHLTAMPAEPKRARRGKPAHLPHERDEKPAAGPVTVQPAMGQAADDIARGLVDTDRRQDAGEVFKRAGARGLPRRRLSRLLRRRR